jgi:hypothetical protein
VAAELLDDIAQLVEVDVGGSWSLLRQVGKGSPRMRQAMQPMHEHSAAGAIGPTGNGGLVPAQAGRRPAPAGPAGCAANAMPTHGCGQCSSVALFPRLRVVQVPVVHAAGPSARIIGRFFRLAPGWGVFHATYFTHLRPIAGCCRHSTLCCSTAARCAPARGGGMVARGGVTRRGGCCCGKPWIWLSVKRTEIQMQAADAQKTAQLQKTLVLWQVIIIGLAYIQPMTLLDTFGMVSRDSVQHVPTSYLIALVAVLLTSISYGHMIRKYPSSGSAYTYVQKSVHPNAGFMVGWSSLLDYLLSPMVNILLANIYLTDMFPR